MIILKTLNELNKDAVLAIGTFDGVHVGHQDVIGTAVSMAKQQGNVAAVLTFREHPLKTIDPVRAPKEIITLRQKERLFATLGVDVLVECDFDKNFADISATDFIIMLTGHQVVVGKDFRFGKNLQGNGADISDVVLRDLVTINGEIVSSTLIRKLIAKGDMLKVNEFLRRPYAIEGRVQRGEQRGRDLGYATINLDLQNYQVPHYGAYVGKVLYQKHMYPAMINIGDNPTFGIVKPRLEAHILDFDKNIYGADVVVEFYDKIRDEKKFESVDALRKQLADDKIFTCRYFNKVV